MTNTQTLGYNMSEMPNAAKPYSTSFTGQLHALPYDKIDNLAPAGSIVSCVKDLSKWLIMQLDSGRYNGKRILPWQVLARTRQMGTILSSRKNGPTHFTGYGLGVFINDYYGKQVYSHTGGADGFVTNTCFIPEENLAITILTNQDNQNFFELLRMQIIDAYLNAPYANKSIAALPAHETAVEADAKKTTDWKARVKGNMPPLPLAAYTGSYENTLYSTIDIAAKEKDLVIKFNGHNNLTAALQYMDNNEWLVTFSNPSFGITSTKFKTENNTVVGIDIKVADFIEYDAYAFKKK